MKARGERSEEARVNVEALYLVGKITGRVSARG
jgi:hypothetical protein